MSQFGLDESPSIRPDEIKPGQVVLDVRDEHEWAAGHIDDAVHVPLDRLAHRMSYDPGVLLSDDPLVVTCKGGGRAGRAVQWLNANGFDALVLDGNMLGWQAAGKPMVSETGQAPDVL